jgi:uncharacterized membrane protein YfcA
MRTMPRLFRGCGTTLAHKRGNLQRETIMPLMKTIATGMLGRTAGKRLARAIPNPALRYLTIAAATTLAPMIARKVRARVESRRLARSSSSARNPALAAG